MANDSHNTVAVTADSFEEEVLKADGPVLVDFWAEWCGPCRMIAPILEELAVEQQGKLKIAKLDVDANPQIAGQYEVMGIPTMLVFKAGKPVERLVGYMPKPKLVAALTPHLS